MREKKEFELVTCDTCAKKLCGMTFRVVTINGDGYDICHECEMVVESMLLWLAMRADLQIEHSWDTAIAPDVP